MTSCIDAKIEGIAFQLFADRGLYWPAQRTLFIADTHFGKDATFRRSGIPVPAGSTETTLAAIDRMLNTSGATCLIILGDMFHARSSLSPSTVESLDAFFGRHADVCFKLILGNHDRHIRSLPAAWPIGILQPGEIIENVVLTHEPGFVPDTASLLLCGHIHPSIRIGTRSDRLGKIGCFWLSNRCLVLPAIGDFTGTHAITPAKDDKIWLVVEDNIVEHGLR